MESFWQSIYDFFTNNITICAIVVALTFIATILEKSQNIWTPIQASFKYFKTKRQEKKDKEIKEEKQKEEMYVSIQSILKDIQGLKNDVQGCGNKDQETTEHLLKIDEKLNKLNDRVYENERDRIKGELSNCAARCMRGIKIYPEEFIHIQEIYDKYSNELHSNHRGTDNYNTIKSFYESQEFLKVK